MTEVRGDLQGLNKEFAKRLFNYAKEYGSDLIVVSGYRSIEEQRRLYNLYLAGKGNLAAPPGRSFHNFHGAADVRHANGVRPGKSPRARSLIRKHGLSLPVRGEPWHVQPAGWSKARCAKGPHLMTNNPIRGAMYDRSVVSLVQRQMADLGLYEGKIDGVWGPQSREAMVNVRKLYNAVHSPKVPENSKIDSYSTRVFKTLFEDAKQPTIPVPTKPEPKPTTLAQVVVSSKSSFDGPLAQALASVYHWRHLFIEDLAANRDAYELGWIIAVGAAANMNVSSYATQGVTELAGPTRVETAQAVVNFIGEVTPGTEDRRGNPVPDDVSEGPKV